MALGYNEGLAFRYGKDAQKTSREAGLVKELLRLNHLKDGMVCLPNWGEASLILVADIVDVEKLALPAGYRVERMQPHQGKDQYTGPWKLTNESPENRQTTGWFEYEIRHC